MAIISKPAAQVISLAVSFNLAAMIAVGLRFLAMKRIGRSIKVHDWLCILSLIFCIVYSVTMIIASIRGDVGKHVTEVAIGPQVALKAYFFSQLFWAVSITTFRLSMLFVYLELFSLGNFFYYAYTMIGMVCLFFIGSLATTLRMCVPIRRSWDPTIPGGKCGSIQGVILASAAINLVFNTIIVLLPLPLVWGLFITKQRKIALTMTFALGFILSALNVGRIIQAKRCNMEDPTYCILSAILLTIPEMAVGVIVTCFPLLGPLIFPNRYVTPDTSRYDNLHEQTRKQGSTSRLNHGPSSNGLHETPSLDIAWDAMDLNPIGKRRGDHEAWARPEIGREDSSREAKIQFLDKIRVDTEIEVTVGVAPKNSYSGNR